MKTYKQRPAAEVRWRQQARAVTDSLFFFPDKTSKRSPNPSIPLLNKFPKRHSGG